MSDVRPWSVSSSTHPLRDRWISVRADHCRTADGVDISPFYVLEYPDWVIVVAIDDDDRVLMVEQYRHGLGIVSLESPAGGIEPGDADALAAGRRELEEETGFGATRWTHVVSLSPNPANQNNRCHVLLATGVRSVAVAEDDPSERVRIRWTPVAEVVRLAQGGGIVQAMHVAALAVALGRLGRW